MAPHSNHLQTRILNPLNVLVCSSFLQPQKNILISQSKLSRIFAILFQMIAFARFFTQTASWQAELQCLHVCLDILVEGCIDKIQDMCYNKDDKKGKKSKLLTLFLLILGHFCCSVVTSVTFSDNLSIFLIRKKRKVKIILIFFVIQKSPSKHADIVTQLAMRPVEWKIFHKQSIETKLQKSFTIYLF